MTLFGGCYCGAVRYEVEGAPSYESSCHCTICRRTSGAPFVAWFTAPRSGFRFVSGDPTVFASTSRGSRTFCPGCGTPLTFASRDLPDEIDVTTCSLDDPEVLPPRDHTHADSRLAWVELADGLPSFPGARD